MERSSSNQLTSISHTFKISTLGINLNPKSSINISKSNLRIKLEFIQYIHQYHHPQLVKLKAIICCIYIRYPQL